MDLIYLNRFSDIHVLDCETNLSLDHFLLNVITSTVWNSFSLIWICMYTAYPKHVHIDQGSAINSVKWIQFCREKFNGGFFKWHWISQFTRTEWNLPLNFTQTFFQNSRKKPPISQDDNALSTASSHECRPLRIWACFCKITHSHCLISATTNRAKFLFCAWTPSIFLWGKRKILDRSTCPLNCGQSSLFWYGRARRD